MKLALFDIDGTLVQYHRKRNDQAYVRALLEVFGMNVEDHWEGYVSSTDSGILQEISQKRLKREASGEEVARFKESMARWLEREYNEEPFEAAPGALWVWDELSRHTGWKMAVGTGNFEFSARFKLDSAGFDLSGIPLGTADDGNSREKVLGRAYQKACLSHGVERFEKIVYVGDWIWDLRAARSLGWDFIGIGSGETASTLRKAGADTVLPDFHELMAHLEMV